MRILDALVAEKVMGWTWNDASAWSPTGSRWDINGDWLPHYSTDIAAAFEAESKVGEDGAMMELYTDALIDIVSNETASIYNSAIECESWGNNDGHTVAYKLAHATAEQRCIAMLLAVGVSQNEIDAALKQGVSA